MKRCLCLIILLVFLVAHGTCAAYNFNQKQPVKEIKNFGTDLKLQAELSSELEQGLLKFNLDKFSLDNDRNSYAIENNYDVPKLTEGYSGYINNVYDFQNANLNNNYRDTANNQYNNDNNSYNNNKNNNKENNKKDASNSKDNNNNENNDNAMGDSKTQRKCPVMHKMDDDQNDDDVKNFVGTNLFDNCRKKCFSAEDVALLAARKDFELLIPKDLPQTLLTDRMVSVLMHYFYNGNKVIQRMTNDESAKRLVEKAYYDMLGGYMKYYIVPVTKYSFYAGQVSMKTVETVLQLYQQCKSFLNTNGNGWRSPKSNMQDEMQTCNMEPLHGESSGSSDCNGGGEDVSACVNLDLTSHSNDAEDDQIIVCLPKLEPEDCDGYLSNIWFPYKKKHTFNLRSRKSANALVKFYETVSQCYRFQSIPQTSFDKRFKTWIMENIQVHLADEQFYPGLGGIMRIYENLRRGKKAIVFDGDKADDKEIDDSADEDENVIDAEDDEDTARKCKSSEVKSFENQAKELEEEWFDPPLAEKTKRNQIENSDGNQEETISNKDNEEAIGSNGEQELCTKAPTKTQCIPKKKKPKCKTSGTTHTKSKPHTKTHGKTKTHKSKFCPSKLSKLWPTAFFQKIGDFFRNYYKYILLLLLILFLLLLILFLIGWYRKRPRSDRPPKKSKPPPPSKKKPSDTQVKPKRKCFNWCSCFRRKRKQPDEEILIKSDSKSVISTKGHKRLMNTSSSSLLCEPTRKCIPFIKKIKGSDRGYSSSEADKAKGKKPKQKVVTIDEKKNKVSPRRKCCLKKSRTESSVKSNTAGKGILKQGESPSSSWETMSSILKCSGKESTDKSGPPIIETTSLDFTTSDDDKCNSKEKSTTSASPRSLLSLFPKSRNKNDVCRWKRYGLQPSTAPRDSLTSTTTFSDVHSVDHMQKMERFGIQRTELPSDTEKPQRDISPSPTKKKPVKDASPKKKNRLSSFFKRSPRPASDGPDCVPPVTSPAPDHMKRVGITRSNRPDC